MKPSRKKLPSNTEAMQRSFDTLKRTARSGLDIEDWVTNNLGFLGLATPSSQDDVSIHSTIDIYYDIKSLKSNAVYQHYKIKLEQRTAGGAEIKRVLGLTAAPKSTVEQSFAMKLKFEEWPWLVERLAWDLLSDQLKHVNIDSRIIHSILTTYIPHHFSGLTWENLQSMDAAGLFTKNRGNLDETFTDFLFSRLTSTVNPTVALPSDLNP